MATESFRERDEPEPPRPRSRETEPRQAEPKEAEPKEAEPKETEPKETEPSRTETPAAAEVPVVEPPAGDGRGDRQLDPQVERQREELRREIARTTGPSELSGEAVDARLASIRDDEARGLGHAVSRHLDITDPQLMDRARDGSLPGGETKANGSNFPAPEHATRFESPAALARAELALWDSPEAVAKRSAQEKLYAATGDWKGRKFDAGLPITKALGPDAEAHVSGRTGQDGTERSTFDEKSTVRAAWKMSEKGEWYVLTCYPEAK